MPHDSSVTSEDELTLAHNATACSGGTLQCCAVKVEMKTPLNQAASHNASAWTVAMIVSLAAMWVLFSTVSSNMLKNGALTYGAIRGPRIRDVYEATIEGHACIGGTGHTDRS